MTATIQTAEVRYHADRPFAIENAVCAKHDVPIFFAPATGQFYCCQCEAMKAFRQLATVAGKAVAS